MKYIKTYSDNAAYEADKPTMLAPHVGYIEATDEVKYINDMADLYDIYGTTTDIEQSFTITIKEVGKPRSSGFTVISNDNREFGFAYGATVDVAKFGSDSLDKIKSVEKYNLSEMTNLSSLFQGITSMQTFNAKLDASSVTNMNNMFYGCRGLISARLDFDTSSVTNMGGMFQDCAGMTSFDCSSFNTSSVADMSYMFYGCSSLESLDLSNFDTSSVTNMRSMFENCHTLATLNISNWDLSSVGTGQMRSFLNPNWYDITVTMNNTSVDTFEKFKAQMVSDNRLKVTIIRDGHSYQYQNGQWVEV